MRTTGARDDARPSIEQWFAATRRAVKAQLPMPTAGYREDSATANGPSMRAAFSVF